jgi:multidrug transporter EmrE-like cation transporter
MAPSGLTAGWRNAVTPWMLATIGLAVAGQIAYQLGQQSVPRDASPLVVLAIVYFVAGALCIFLAWPLGAFAAPGNLRSALAWPTWVIAFSIVAIELGYLTAYRSGWTIGTAFAISSTLTVFGLAVIAYLVFGKALSLRQLVGLAVSCLALWLLSSGPRAG